MSSLPRRIRIAGSLTSAIVLYVAGGVMVVAGFARGSSGASYWVFAVMLIGVASATLLLPWLSERLGGR
ncbi:hypothetical protein [Nocardioides sp. AX2bis]|uniref:hypothetical protein n=1 Tax=Nocardioides sp. AX2bis TaxID=2653157 RepID=UPI0012F4767B|nr:hypothetical protein [Nocardioides sp. AX2bis]VXC29149.1 hypothetical protein NOCARDAX2BIS_50053 [Nocardioides sp. AX2bis]